MSEDQFTKLFKYMTKRFDELEAKIETKADGDRVYAALDAIAGRLDLDDQERVAMTSQLDRHEEWIKQLARGTDTTLAPGR